MTHFSNFCREPEMRHMFRILCVLFCCLSLYSCRQKSSDSQDAASQDSPKTADSQDAASQDSPKTADSQDAASQDSPKTADAVVPQNSDISRDLLTDWTCDDTTCLCTNTKSGCKYGQLFFSAGTELRNSLLWCDNEYLNPSDAALWDCKEDNEYWHWVCRKGKQCPETVPFRLQDEHFENALYECGYLPPPDNPQGYACDEKDGRSYMFCKDESCPCGDISVAKGTVCVKDSVFCLENCKCGDYTLPSEAYCKNNRPLCGEHEEKDLTEYICLNHRWECDDKCPCGKNICGYGEFCLQGKCVKSWRYGNGSLSQGGSVDAKLCKDGNCPCGDGFCAKGALCDEGQCRCDSKVDNRHGEFICLKGENPDFYCASEKACTTSDGLIYDTGALVSQSAYYLIGESDTSYETLHPDGNCVLSENTPPEKTAKTPGLCVEDEKSLAFASKRKACDIDAVDIVACKGGKRYCHGSANAPLPAPQNPKGYACENTDFVPGNSAKDNLKAWRCKEQRCACGSGTCGQNAFCIDEKCYCGKNEAVENYRCEAGIRICDGENCLCGSSACPANTRCDDGKCFCGDIPVEEGSGACDKIDDNVYGVACKNDTPCGKESCFENETCLRGKRYCGKQIKPDGNFVCTQITQDRRGWRCEEKKCRCYGERIEMSDICESADCPENAEVKNGYCYCGKEKLRGDGSPYGCGRTQASTFARVCFNYNTGCQCGETTCQFGNVCMKGKCYNRTTMTEEDMTLAQKTDGSEKMYRSVYGHWRCERENCPCGENNCKFLEYCMAGTCKRTPYYAEHEGKIYSFDLSRVSADFFLEDQKNRNDLPPEHEESDDYDDYDDYDEDCDERCQQKAEKARQAEKARMLEEARKEITLTVYDTERVLNEIVYRKATTCGDKQAPAALADYDCAIDDKLNFAGWFCKNPAGCACGKNPECPFLSRCRDNICVGDDFLSSERCIAYDDGYCRHALSKVRPRDIDAEAYREAPLGYICIRDRCLCGDKLCSFDNFCLRPDMCFSSPEYNASDYRD